MHAPSLLELGQLFTAVSLGRHFGGQAALLRPRESSKPPVVCRVSLCRFVRSIYFNKPNLRDSKRNTKVDANQSANHREREARNTRKLDESESLFARNHMHATAVRTRTSQPTARHESATKRGRPDATNESRAVSRPLDEDPSASPRPAPGSSGIGVSFDLSLWRGAVRACRDRERRHTGRHETRGGFSLVVDLALHPTPSPGAYSRVRFVSHTTHTGSNMRINCAMLDASVRSSFT